MAGSCPPTAPTGPPQGAPLSPMLPAHTTRRKPPGSTGPPAAGGAKAGQPQATQAQDDTGLPVPETCARLADGPPSRRCCAMASRSGPTRSAAWLTGPHPLCAAVRDRPRPLACPGRVAVVYAGMASRSWAGEPANCTEDRQVPETIEAQTGDTVSDLGLHASG